MKKLLLFLFVLFLLFPGCTKEDKNSNDKNAPVIDNDSSTIVYDSDFKSGSDSNSNLVSDEDAAVIVIQDSDKINPDVDIVSQIDDVQSDGENIGDNEICLPDDIKPDENSDDDTLKIVPDEEYNDGKNHVFIDVVLRDFMASHPDFETKVLGHEKNLVKATLGIDKKPVFNNEKTGETSIESAESFSQWFNDVPGVNAKAVYKLVLTEKENAFGVYSFYDDNFFPLDNLLLGNEENKHNYHFTLEMHTTFTYRKGDVFTFIGDDDVWVFINNKLVIDLGGIHNQLSQSVSLDSLGLAENNVYALDLFFCERHTVESHFKVETTIADMQSWVEER